MSVSLALCIKVNAHHKKNATDSQETRTLGAGMRTSPDVDYAGVVKVPSNK